jgi:hypothetical protein
MGEKDRDGDRGRGRVQDRTFSTSTFLRRNMNCLSSLCSFSMNSGICLGAGGAGAVATAAEPSPAGVPVVAAPLEGAAADGGAGGAATALAAADACGLVAARAS